MEYKENCQLWRAHHDESAFDWLRGKAEVDWAPGSRILFGATHSPPLSLFGNSQGKWLKRSKLSPESRRSGHNLGKPGLEPGQRSFDGTASGRRAKRRNTLRCSGCLLSAYYRYLPTFSASSCLLYSTEHRETKYSRIFHHEDVMPLQLPLPRLFRLGLQIMQDNCK